MVLGRCSLIAIFGSFGWKETEEFFRLRGGRSWISVGDGLIISLFVELSFFGV